MCGIPLRTNRHHFTLQPEDVVKSGIPVDIEKITGHQLVRGRGGKLAVMYETLWESLSSITWEREIDLKNFSRHMLEYWMSTPRQVNGVNSKYRAMRRAQAHRAYWHHKNKYYLEQGYHLVSYSTWERKFRGQRVPLRAFFWWENPRLVVGTGEGMGQRCL